MLHLAVQTRSDIPKLFLFWLLLLDLDACQTRKCKPVETEITKQLIVFVFDTPKSSSGKQPACCTLLCTRRKAGTTHLSIDCSSFVTQRHKLLWEFKAQAVPIMSTRFCVGISKSCSPCDSTFPGIFHLHLVNKSWSSAPQLLHPYYSTKHVSFAIHRWCFPCSFWSAMYCFSLMSFTMSRVRDYLMLPFRHLIITCNDPVFVFADSAFFCVDFHLTNTCFRHSHRQWSILFKLKPICWLPTHEDPSCSCLDKRPLFRKFFHMNSVYVLSFHEISAFKQFCTNSEL
jgi:hypothetical protein